MWIARDGDDGEIWLYNNKPTKNSDNTYFIGSGDVICTIKLEDYVDEEFKIMFGIDNLTFENSPIEVELVIKNTKNVTT